MRLADFILEHEERILQEFEDFARTHTAAGEAMDIAALRDHASAILRAVALDIDQPQSSAEQKKKSMGDAPAAPVAATPTPAEQHGADRAGSGFSLPEMFAEYRALRASVPRLWVEMCNALNPDDINDLMRFNEAIDQALAESITMFSTGVEESKEMFIAILGHDLRTPLGAVLTAADFLAEEGSLTGANATMVSRIRSSGRRMESLIGDLLDFTRSRLGRGIPVDLEKTDLGAVLRETVAEVSANYPGVEFHVETTGNITAVADAGRITQALSNLIGNARQHGAANSPITVGALGKAGEVVISVHNVGSVIEAADQRVIFEPYKRNSAQKRERDGGSMGLGLYIAREIAVAHGGWIEIRSSAAEGTTFSFHIPRDPKRPPESPPS
jgi:signal transduction histidine kinase